MTCICSYVGTEGVLAGVPRNMHGGSTMLTSSANAGYTAFLCSSRPKIRNPTGILQHQYRKVAPNGVRIGLTDRLAMGVIN